MKNLFTSKNLQYVAMGIIGVLVLIWVYRYIRREGFQTESSNTAITSAQKALAAEGSTGVCGALMSTKSLLSGLNSPTVQPQIDSLNSQMCAASCPEASNCPPAAAPAATPAPASPPNSS